MLVERYGCFGGNITQAGVESIAWYRHEKTVDAGGIGVEFENRAKDELLGVTVTFGCSGVDVSRFREYVKENSAHLGDWDDVRNEARFEDSIGIFPEFLDGYGVVIIPTTGRYFQVPYGIILPQKVENLLVAGRCVAGDKISHAATRQMMCCTVTGQCRHRCRRVAKGQCHLQGG
jgi:hypothetical protein